MLLLLTFFSLFRVLSIYLKKKNIYVKNHKKQFPLIFYYKKNVDISLTYFCQEIFIELEYINLKHIKILFKH